MTVNDRPVRKLTFEARAAGAVVTVIGSTAAVLPLGTRVTIAFDPADPTVAVLVEDLDGLGQAHPVGGHRNVPPPYQPGQGRQAESNT